MKAISEMTGGELSDYHCHLWIEYHGLKVDIQHKQDMKRLREVLKTIGQVQQRRKELKEKR